MSQTSQTSQTSGDTTGAPRDERRAPGGAIRVTFALLGAALVAAAIAADRAFFERHVLLPYYYVRPAWSPLAVRAMLVVAGLVLAAVVGPAAARRRWQWGGAVRASIALLAALPASELVLRIVEPADARSRWARWAFNVGALHPRYGWASRPAAATTARAGDREFVYVTGPAGGRVRSNQFFASCRMISAAAHVSTHAAKYRHRRRNARYRATMIRSGIVMRPLPMKLRPLARVVTNEYRYCWTQS